MMKKLRNYVSAGIGFVLLISVLALAIPQTGHGTAAPDREVLVINPPSAAVPVAIQGTPTISGSVAVSNTPTVNAQQSGPWNVGITGTPTVNIGSTPTVGTRPSVQGAFTLYDNVGFPESRRYLLGPFPPGRKLAIGTVGFFNHNQSRQGVNFGVVELIGEDQSSCSAIPFLTQDALLLNLAFQEERVLSFPYPMVLPAVPPAGPWCLFVSYQGDGGTGNGTLVTGFSVDP
jgi:hypothetical protein